MYGLMNVAKIEGEKYNIMVNLISPGAQTRMTGTIPGRESTEERAQLMAPEHVAPAVTYLSSPRCQESGIYIDASGGRYGRTAIVHSDGVKYDAHDFKDADWFESNWKAITDVRQAKVPWFRRHGTSTTRRRPPPPARNPAASARCPAHGVQWTTTAAARCWEPQPRAARMLDSGASLVGNATDDDGCSPAGR